jgi:hypothetical protein
MTRRKRLGWLAVIAIVTVLFGSAAPAAYAEESNEAMPGLPVLPAVQRNCDNVTCNFYFARSETARIQQEIGSKAVGEAVALNGLICLPTGPGAPACTAGLTIHEEEIKRNVKAAVGRGGCFVLRYNVIGAALGVASTAALSFGNVAGTHQFCRP